MIDKNYMSKHKLQDIKHLLLRIEYLVDNSADMCDVREEVQEDIHEILEYIQELYQKHEDLLLVSRQ